MMARSCREASVMGEVVSIKNRVGWKLSIAVGLLLLPALAGWALGAEAGSAPVASATVGSVEYNVAAGALEAGTADDPFAGPVPGAEGVASRLVGVTSDVHGGTAQVELVGDGVFQWAAFQLADPARFVLDLTGVVKSVEQASVAVDHDVLSHVRVGQYRAYPDPVSRIVFDLETPALPRIESTADGLRVSFASASYATPTVVAAAAPMEEMVVAEPVAVAIEPTFDEPVIEEPVIEEPVIEEPVIEEPVIEEPVIEEPVIEEPVIDEPLAFEPVIEEPTVEDVAAEVPAEELPADYESYSAAAEPMVEPVMVEPVMVEPVMVEPVMAAPAQAESAQIDAAPAAPVQAEPATREEIDLLLAEAIETAPTIMPPPQERAGEAQFQVAAAAPMEAAPMPAPQPPAPSVAASTRQADSAAFDVANVQVEQASSGAEPTESFEPQSVDAERRYQGEPMDLSLQDADVKDVLRSFAQLSGLNVVVQPGVSGRVTVELVQVPWDQALEQILKINNLGYELDGNIMRIAPISTLRAEAEEQQRLIAARALSVPLSTVIRRVSYAKAGEVAGVLTARGGVMSNRGSVIVDRRTNTLILKELPSYMNTVIAIIENLDIPEPQVMIEARIIETTKRFARTLGIEWSFQGVSSAATGNTTGLQFPNNGTVDGGVNLLTGADNGFINLALGNILNTFNLDATLHAAESEGLINVLSAPRVATLNNERASIQSGLQIPIQTVANNTVSVQFVNATLRLDVTPQVTAEGTILMDINIQKREPQLAFAVVGARNAPIATKEARTRVIVRDGGTTVIGGIYEVSTDQGEDRVPGLANVPVIKHLFKNKRRQDENEELLIFITPRVTKL